MNRFVLVVRTEYDQYDIEESWPIETTKSREELQNSLMALCRQAAEDRRKHKWEWYKLPGYFQAFAPHSLLEYAGDNPHPPRVLTVDEWFAEVKYES
jgi:hypothetical protein